MTVLNSNTRIVKGFSLLIGYLGIFVMFIGVLCLFPLLILLQNPEESQYAPYFILPGVVSIIVGFGLYLNIRNHEVDKLENHQDLILVSMIWITSVFICSIPFLLTGEYSFIQSLFESTSGFSTTGLSVVNVELAPKMILLFRSLLLFIGGVGLVLVILSIMSDRYGMRLYFAEGHSDKLLPNLVKSTRLILAIYGVYIFLGAGLYVIFGMTWFDAVNHAIAAVSTGGFSTKAQSIGAFNSPPIEIVTIVLMLLGSTNFLIHLFLLKGRIGKCIKHNEGLFFLIIVAVGLPITIYEVSRMGYSFPESIRHGIFQFVSAITTTGFQTLPTFNGITTSFISILIVFMLIGAQLGSTGGGMKLHRVQLFLKSMIWNIRERLGNKRQLHSKWVFRMGEKVIITEKEITDNYSFIGLYVIIFIVGSYIFSFYGYSLQESMFEFASSIGTVGLSVGITGINAHWGILITSIIGMLLGRLEIYILVLSFVRIFKKTNRKVI